MIIQILAKLLYIMEWSEDPDYDSVNCVSWSEVRIQITTETIVYHGVWSGSRFRKSQHKVRIQVTADSSVLLWSEDPDYGRVNCAS
jgi:hypothetical protein